jgi:eukaryotic-like serine/threonine-protein kinase
MLYKTFEFETVIHQRVGETFTQHTYQRKVKFFTENISDRVTLDMIAVPGGAFDMEVIPGATFQMSFNEIEDSERKTQYKVTVKPFYLAQYLITQEQWRTVMGINPSKLTRVDSISWNEATEFCQKLSQITGKNYRLPSEAEWEYAFRGETADVGSDPTYFGIYEMGATTPREWCSDNWYSKYEGPAIDSGGPILDNTEGQRGGSWNCTATRCRGPYRRCFAPDHKIKGLYFFRVALDIISGEDF